ncbi:MAG TPA: hypothetical protein VNI77_00530 [Nitrososphaera sp.]|nr:hypothetical protein [Nitrososphaera sp.]
MNSRCANDGGQECPFQFLAFGQKFVMMDSVSLVLMTQRGRINSNEMFIRARRMLNPRALAFQLYILSKVSDAQS